MISWSKPSYHCLNVFTVSHLQKVVNSQYREKEGPRIYCSVHLFDLLPTDSLADYKHHLGHFKNCLNNSELSPNPKKAHPDSSEPEDRLALLYKTSISWSLAIFPFRIEGKRAAGVPAKGLTAVINCKLQKRKRNYKVRLPWSNRSLQNIQNSQILNDVATTTDSGSGKVIWNFNQNSWHYKLLILRVLGSKHGHPYGKSM